VKVQISKHLSNQKDTLKELVSILSKDFQYVSILGVDTKGKSYNVSRTGVNINDPMWAERGFVLRVHNGHNYSEFSFNQISKDNLDELVNRIEPEDKRAEFELVYRKFSGAVEGLLPSNVGTEIINDLRWVSYIRAAAKAKFAPGEEMDIADCGEKVREIIDEHLKSLGVRTWIEPITLFEDDFKSKIYPTTVDSSGKDNVFVGRVREDISCPNGICMWVVGDQLRKGAALNAIQIAELLRTYNLV